jgi:hypothetical protein
MDPKAIKSQPELLSLLPKDGDDVRRKLRKSYLELAPGL